MSNILVSLSGGIDSTTTLAIAVKLAKETGGKVAAISFDYGQRHSKELSAASEIAFVMGVQDWDVIEMPHSHLSSALTDPTREIPKVSYAEIEGKSPAYVPMRNGLMAMLLAGYAESHDFDTIMMGVHAEDAQGWAYADCTMEFMGPLAAAIYIASYGKVRLVTPLINMTKDEVVSVGFKLGAPLELTWSCYIGGNIHCGVCPTCRARKEAFKRANIIDATPYAE